MRVEDIGRFLDQLQERVARDPTLMKNLSRVLPAMDSFTFQSPDEFEAKAKKTVSQWLPQLAGKAFHVRMHRHGFKGRLSSHEEERMLAEFVLERLEEGGSSARISFHEADFLVEVVTVGQRAGLSLWSREDGKRFPFLRLARD
jgi:adenylyl- and sulfurtransferase ThiI